MLLPGNDTHCLHLFREFAAFPDEALASRVNLKKKAGSPPEPIAPAPQTGERDYRRRIPSRFRFPHPIFFLGWAGDDMGGQYRIWTLGSVAALVHQSGLSQGPNATMLGRRGTQPILDRAPEVLQL